MAVNGAPLRRRKTKLDLDEGDAAPVCLLSVWWFLESRLLSGKTVCAKPLVAFYLAVCSLTITSIGTAHVILCSNTLLLMPLPVGSNAPDFTLKTKTAEGLRDVRLGENFGKCATVLLFFPLAFTSVCTREMCDTSSGLAEYEKLGAKVIAISVDSPYAQQAWAAANGIKVEIVSDLNKAVTKAYDVLYSMPSGIGDTSARAAFVIGADGLIKYAEQSATTKDLPNFAAIKAALAI